MADRVLGLVGAGIMGSGIAELAARQGYQVILRDLGQAQLDGAMRRIEGTLNRGVQRGFTTEEQKQAALANIKTTTSLQDVAAADIIIENVFEEMEVKAEVFSELDRLCPPETVLASNTSTFPITEIAAATERPDKVIGMHFFNPVYAMRGVEVIRGLLTSDETVEAAKALAEGLGKTAVVVNDSAGFIVNRLLAPMINEAAFMYMEGLASKEDIDNLMKLAANHPMGPLELADLIGLDICLHEIETLYESFGDPKYRPCPLIKRMVAAGLLGRKTGKGFYEYSQ